jgi:hypothetical protein
VPRFTAQEFADWTSPDFVLNPGQYLILTDSKLHIAEVTTTVSVVDSPEQVAIEQLKIEETQRVFGIIPNFYVVYDPAPARLTTKLKFHLALRTSTDVVTVLGVGLLAGINQAGDVPDYVQGAKGYFERYGAAAADGFSDIMIGGAMLPSLLRQAPRYYYQGTGTNKSRALHALSRPFRLQGRQRTVATQLLEHRWRSELVRSLQPLLSGSEPRHAASVPEFLSLHRRAHAQRPATGVRLEQGHAQTKSYELVAEDTASGARRGPAATPEIAMCPVDAKELGQLRAGEEERNAALESDHHALGDEVDDRASLDQPGNEGDQGHE